jgi:predicted flavoprotein YhiN
VIGGGAAGMMAAYFAKLNNPEAEVLLFEKNKYIGAKVIISGGGRCNVTTGILEVTDVLKNYPRGAEFLKKAIYGFPPEAVINWFESQGVELKTEADLRVFPVSNDGKDVVGALENALRELGVKILLESNVVKIRKVDAVEDALNILENERNFVVILKNSAVAAGVKSQAPERKFFLDKLIITTGGNAYRQTGSTGDGYAFAQALGHTITDLAPSLASLLVPEEWIAELAGVALKRVKLQFISADGERKFERTGPMLFTHRGVTGPAVFALSALAAYEKFGLSLSADNKVSTSSPARLIIDLLPEITAEELDKKLQEDLHGTKLLKNILGFYLPHSLVERILKNISEEENADQMSGKNFADQLMEGGRLMTLTAAEVSKEIRWAVGRGIKAFELGVVGRGAGDEFVTAGGVKLEEVNPSTMESKLVPGLYFAGEILDVDGFTGGFNLQASWAAGSLAGESC